MRWSEVRAARGEAIQLGFQEQQVVDREVRLLVDMLQEEIDNNFEKEAFQLKIPPSQNLQGSLNFYRVLAVEEGYQAPPAELRLLCELSRIDQWRR